VAPDQAPQNLGLAAGQMERRPVRGSLNRGDLLHNFRAAHDEVVQRRIDLVDSVAQLGKGILRGGHEWRKGENGRAM
jgi:hypothetical protein